MKRNLIYLLLVLPLLVLLGSCDDKEEIVFDHELPQFELKENAILLEVIMPQGTSKDDEIYIVGEYNGGEDVAVEQLEWRLEKASNSEVKWGIYLIPSTFKDGKTLADGFYFFSKKNGAERTVKNEDSIHRLDIGIGTRTNVWVNRWESYFEPEDPDEETHDGYVIYVEDNSTWETLSLYAWGDAELGGGWPGIQVTGTKTIGKVTYKYFDTGESFKGLSINLIFNDNGGGKQLEGEGLNITLDRDYYFRITDTSYEEIILSDYEGYTIYIEDATTWGVQNAYGWADGGDVTPSWPGIAVTGTKDINGVTYKYIEMGEDLNGKFMNLILNGGTSQAADIPVTLDRDYYFRVTDSGSTEVDPYAPEPEEPEEPGEAHFIYVIDNTDWEGLSLYGYGGAVLGGAWPGLSVTGTKEIDGIVYKYFSIAPENDGKGINLIFNGNGGTVQLPDLPITLNRDYYFTITATGCTELDPPATN